jgi:hypothetical protein
MRSEKDGTLRSGESGDYEVEDRHVHADLAGAVDATDVTEAGTIRAKLSEDIVHAIEQGAHLQKRGCQRWILWRW